METGSYSLHIISSKQNTVSNIQIRRISQGQPLSLNLNIKTNKQTNKTPLAPLELITLINSDVQKNKSRSGVVFWWYGIRATSGNEYAGVLELKAKYNIN